MISDILSVPGLAAMDAGVDVYQIWFMVVRTGFAAHDLPLRVINKGLHL